MTRYIIDRYGDVYISASLLKISVLFKYFDEVKKNEKNRII